MDKNFALILQPVGPGEPGAATCPLGKEMSHVLSASEDLLRHVATNLFLPFGLIRVIPRPTKYRDVALFLSGSGFLQCYFTVISQLCQFSFLALVIYINQVYVDHPLFSEPGLR